MKQIHLPLVPAPVILAAAEGKSGQIDLAKNDKPLAVIVANDAKDLAPGSSNRVHKLVNYYKNQNWDVKIISYLPTAHVNEASAHAFRKSVAESAQVMIALGGADVDPSLYGETLTYSKNTDLNRDIDEYKLIKTYKQTGKGFFVGICRGHQLGAIIDGHTLYQDIKFEGVVSHDLHKNQDHPIVWEKDFQFLKSDVFVNSRHHQAVKLNESGMSKAIAFSEDGVVEALKQKDGRGISFQFHPEDFLVETSMQKELGKKIFKFVNSEAARMYQGKIKVSKANKCAGVFSN